MDDILLTTLKGEQVLVNLAHVDYIGERKNKEGVIVRFADSDYIECVDSIQRICRHVDSAILLVDKLIKKLENIV